MVCSGYIECNNGDEQKVLLHKEELHGGSECYNYFWNSKYVMTIHSATVVWGKLYKRKTICDMKFERLSYGEDTLFITSLWKKNIKVLNCDFAGYYYNRNSESTTKKINENLCKYIIDMLECYRKICDMYCNIDVRAVQDYERLIMDSIFSLKRHIGDKKIFYIVRKDIKKHILEIKKYENVSFKTKVFLQMYYYFPQIVWKIL